MKDSIRFKLEAVGDRFEEIAGLLSDPEVIGDQNRFRELSMEYSRIEPVVKLFSEFQSLSHEISSAEEMVNDSDPDIRSMGEEELESLTERRDTLAVVREQPDRDGELEFLDLRFRCL